MSSLMQIKNLKEASGRNAKLKVLEGFSPLAIKYLKYCWDPAFTFGVSPQKNIKDEDRRPDPLDDDVYLELMLDAAQKLSDDVYGSNTLESRKVAVNVELMGTPEQSHWWRRLLYRDPEVGVSGGTLNSLFPDTIRYFRLCKAGTFAGILDNGPWVLEPKFDGWRTQYVKIGNVCTCYSSNGNVLGLAKVDQHGNIIEMKGGVGFICESILKILGDVDLVIDGETCGVDWQAAPSSGAKKPDPNLRAWAFDVIDPEYWQKDFPVPLEYRRIVLSEVLIPRSTADRVWDFTTISNVEEVQFQFKWTTKILDDLKHRRGIVKRGPDKGSDNPPPGPLSYTDERVQITPQVPVTSSDEVRRLTVDLIDRGFEGSIVKKVSSKLRMGRHEDWLKSKEEVEKEFRIIDVEWRNKQPAIIVDVDGVKVSVGNLSNDEIKYFMQQADSIREGKPWGSIRYQKKTRDGSLRHPRFIRLRDEKSSGSI
jgi:hypothetical protein